MKRLSMFAILVFAHTTFAEPPSGKEPTASPDAKFAEALVQRELLQPLAAKERDQSRFSRARLPAQERRVRVLDDRARKDALGGTFVRFAVDARHGFHAVDDEASWNLATVAGCVYLDRGEVFIKKGDQVRPAAFLLGKNLKPAAPEICQGEAEVAHAN
jgi:hypothetical protein